MNWYDQQMQRLHDQYHDSLLSMDELLEEMKKVERIYDRFKRTAVIKPHRPSVGHVGNVIYVEFRK